MKKYFSKTLFLITVVFIFLSGASIASAAPAINALTATPAGLVPSSTIVGGLPFSLTVNGSGFVNGTASAKSTVNFNGVTRATTFVSSTRLTANILTSDIATAGVYNVTVTNPGTITTTASLLAVGPETSNAVPFTVIGTYTLTVNSSGATNVPITGSSATYSGNTGTTGYTKTGIVSGTSFSLTAPLTSGGKNFSNWVGCTSGTGVTCNITMNATKGVTAVYTTASTYTLTVNTVGVSGITIAGSPSTYGGVVNPNSYTKTNIPANTPITLTAPVVSGLIFSGWTGGCTSSTATCSVTMNATKNVTANYTTGNPVPNIMSLSPNPVIAASGAFTLTISGSGFIPSSTGTFNGVLRTITYDSPSQLRMQVLASDITTVGSRNVRVTNPGPGGGNSNTVPLTVSPNQGYLFIRKYTASDPSNTTFNYIVNPGTISQSVPTSGGTGSNGLNGLLLTAGTYSLTETVPANWTLNYLYCTKQDGSPIGTASGNAITGISVTAGQTTFCEFSNTYSAPTGFIRITKNTTGTGGPGGNFFFTSTTPVLNNFFGATTNPLNVPAGTNGSASRTTGAIPVGTYNITESSMPGGYSLVPSPSCYNPSTNVTSPINAIVVGAGQTTTCTFTDSYTAPNPVPNITSLNPNPVTVYGSGFSLQVNGTNFVQGIVGRVGGANRTTTYNSPTQFLMQMLPSDITTIGQRMIQGVNPGPPGGGAGNMQALNVVKASPTITTVIKNAANNVATNNIIAGQQTYDTSTLNGATPNAGGTMTYRLYPDNTCTGGIIAGVKNVVAGVPGDSNPLTSPDAGTFYWGAYYSGDANNNAFTSPCTSEVLTVAKKSPTVATVIKSSATNLPINTMLVGASAYDTSTLAGATSNAGGTMTYTVFSNNTCTTGAFYATGGVKTVANAVVPNSNNITFPTASVYYWEAYYSGDANNNSGRSPCTAEVLTVNNAPPVNPKLTINKGVVNAGGGTATTNSFAPYRAGANTLALGVATSIAPGTYSIIETAVANYTATYSASCAGGSITMSYGTDQICTITNTYVATPVTALRIVKNTPGSTLNTTFNYTVTGPTNQSPNITTVSGTGQYGPAAVGAGIYSIIETVPTGWTFGSASCTLQNGNPTGTSSTNGRTGITVIAGQTTTCTFANNERGALRIIKNTTGGDSPFDYTVTGPSGSNPSVNTSGGTATVGPFWADAGTTYSVTETVPTGWTFGSASCTLQNSNPTGTSSTNGRTGITVIAGQTTTCTFANTYSSSTMGSIKVIKNTVGGNGAFTFSTNFSFGGPLTTSGGTAQRTIANLTPGSTYSLTETVPSGWTLNSIDCKLQSNAPTGTGSVNGKTGIGVIAGQMTTCTVTNTLTTGGTGQIKVQKITNGGTGGTFTFGGNFFGSGSLTTSGSNGYDEKIISNLAPASNYSISENVPTGWTLASAGCTNWNGTLTGITVAAGAMTTCVFTNTWNATAPPRITINKVLVPSNDTGRFNLQIDGATSGSGSGVGNNGTTGSFQTTVGSHTINETAGTSTSLNDYTSVISNGTGTTNCPTTLGGSITLANGDNKVCTITNTKKPKLTINKTVVNTGCTTGCATASSFAPYRAGSNTLTVGQATSIAPGTYSITETNVTNYTPTYSSSCSGGSITMSYGTDQTCTITNTYTPAIGSIKIVKNTTGGGGAFNFTSNFGFPNPLTTGAPNYTAYLTVPSLAPGNNYSISENTQSGWTLSSVACTLESGSQTGSNATNGKSSITVEAGKVTTCTFNNTKVAATAKLTIVKSTAGQGTGGDFIFNSPLPASNNSLNSFIGSGNPLTTSGSSGSATRIAQGLVPATYDLAEIQMPAGYALTSASCTNSKGTYDDQTDTIKGINLIAGDDITCTFLNTYTPPPTLKLIKIVDNTGGGTKQPSDWTLTATDLSDTYDDGFNDTGDPDEAEFHTVTAYNGYALSEYTLVNYTLSDVICDGGSLFGNIITLDPGEDVTCEIYNTWNPLPATLKLSKTVVNTGGGTKQAGDWNLTATAFSGGFTDKGDSTVFHKISSGIEYTLSESVVGDYTTNGVWSCPGGKLAGNNKVSLDPGQNITCTVTNTYAPPTTGRIKIIKNTTGTTVSATFDYAITGPSGLNPSITTSGGTGDSGSMTATVGTTYLIKETVPSGWTFETAVCRLESGSQVGTDTLNGKSGVTVEVGKLTTCTFTNKLQGALRIIKNAIGGNDTFNYSVSGLSASNPSITTSSGIGEVGPIWVHEATTYSIVETLLTGWTFIPPVVCTLQSGSQTGANVTNGKSNITIESGKLTTCTFKNTQSAKGSIEIIKKTDKKVDKDTEFNYQIELKP